MRGDTLAQVRQLVLELDRLTKELILDSAKPYAGGSVAHSNRKKLGKQEVKSIRDLKRIGCSNKEIADVFDVNPATISRIVRGQYHRV